MKKLRFLALAAMAAFAVSVSAQVTYGNDYQYKPTSGTLYGADNESFGLFYAQYNLTTEHITVTNHDSENTSLNGVTLGYSHFIPLGDIPLFLSPGAAVQWFFKSKDGHKTNMISAKIPVNLVYSFQVSDNFRIEPYAGIYGRINIWGQEKVGDESANILSSDDFGDAACKRFQLGWNAGVQFRITEAFTIGAGYFMDLMKLQNYSSGKHDIKTNFQGFDFTLGINL
jgi:opacity protein-like surface antigen